MGKITLTTFLSIDGVMQAPGGDGEDRSGGFTLGGWVIPFSSDPLFGRTVGSIFERCEALLLGRNTYLSFKGFWPQVRDPDNVAAVRINTGPRYVVSQTLVDDSWTGTHIIADPFAELDVLRARHSGEIQVHGSAMLAGTLLAGNVFDEVRLLTFPVVLGKGKRLFSEHSLPGSYELISAEAGASGIVVSTYTRIGDVRTATATPDAV